MVRVGRSRMQSIVCYVKGNVRVRVGNTQCYSMELGLVDHVYNISCVMCRVV